MSIQKQNILTNYEVCSVEFQIKNAILFTLGSTQDPKEQANKEKISKVLFNNFFNKKFPILQNHIQQLLNERCISSLHFPMTIIAIFYTYLDELIEHYQDQQEERDQ